MNKKLTLVFLGLLLLFSIFPYTAMAATKKEGMGGILDTVYDIFNWIPQYLTLEKLMSGDEKAVFLARLLVWIIIFSMTHFGLKFIGSKGVRAAIAFVIGVMGAALIPEKILFNIFQTYSIIGAVVIWAVPMIFGYLAINKISKEHSYIRAFIYLIIFLVLYSINDSMDEFFGYRGMESWFGYFKLLYIPVIFGFLSNLTRGVRGGRTGQGFEGTRLSNWNPFRRRGQAIPTIQTGATGQTAAQRAAGAEAGAAEKAEKGVERAEFTEERLTEIVERVEKRGMNENQRIVKDLQGISQYLEYVQRTGSALTPEIIEKINKAINEISSWESNVRKDLAGIDAMLKKHAKITKAKYLKEINEEKIEEKLAADIKHELFVGRGGTIGNVSKREEDEIRKYTQSQVEETREQYRELQVLNTIEKQLTELENNFKPPLVTAVNHLGETPPKITEAIAEINKALGIKQHEEELLGQAANASLALVNLEKSEFATAKSIDHLLLDLKNKTTIK